MNNHEKNRRFVVLGTITPWVYALAEALSAQHDTSAVVVYDWRSYLRDKLSWMPQENKSKLSCRLWLYPPGYLGRFRSLFYPLMARRLQRMLRQGRGDSQQQTWLITPYPWLAPPQIPVQLQNVIYYNLDDYTIYRRERAVEIQRQEEKTINQSRLVICLAERQVRFFKSQVSQRSHIVRHFPLGVDHAMLPPREGMRHDSNTVTYVGNLGDRVDWQLFVEVAHSMPQARFLFVGGMEETTGSGKRPDWLQWRAQAFRLPNVQHQPKMLHREVAQYYWSAAINWIPYAVEHPFNVASCPTKIMDGLASGRPVLSSRVPECCLYPEWIQTFESASAARTLIQQYLNLISRGEWNARSQAQLRFARQNLWSERAKTLVQWIDELDHPSQKQTLTKTVEHRPVGKSSALKSEAI